MIALVSEADQALEPRVSSKLHPPRTKRKKSEGNTRNLG